MILKSVLTEEGFQNLVNFLNSDENELWTGMFLLEVEYAERGNDPSELLVLSVPIKPSSGGSTSANRVVDKGDKVKLARLVNSGAFQVETLYGFISGHEVVLEIGQQLSHQKSVPFGEVAPSPERLHVEMATIMSCIQPLFEILCKFQVEDKKV